MLIAVGVAGAAYAASSVTNQYIITTFKVNTKKADRKAIGTVVTYTVASKPKGQRPNVIKGLTVTIQGVKANGNDFPTCSSSRLLEASQGPSTCPKGSLAGTGYFKAEIGKSGQQSAPASSQLTCRVELSVYNSGNHRLTYYLYLNPSQAGECPNTGTLPVAITAHLSETRGGNLVQTFTFPQSVRHPLTGSDSVPVFSTLNIPGGVTKVHGKKVGEIESVSCPPNHSRQLAIKFTLENGSSRTATRNTRC
jgi:hypothetical protein